MRFGVICSAGGSAFFSAADIAMRCGLLDSEDIAVVTDRPCGAEERCAEYGISHTRIEQPDNRAFSDAAADLLAGSGCEVVLFFFTRFVTESLFQRLPCLNIHPSLLPAYPGFGALAKARKDGSKFVGATMHLADATQDGGAIVAQVASPVAAAADGEHWARMSYIQKTYLTLGALEWINSGAVRLTAGSDAVVWTTNPRTTPAANPALLNPDCINAFEKFQRQFAMTAVIP